MIPTYGEVLSAIEKTLQELMEEYQGVRRSLWDLIENQKRNTAQLVRIGAMMEQRWCLKKDSQSSNKKDKEDRDKEEGSEDGPSVMGYFGHEQFLFSFSFIFLLYRDFVFFFFWTMKRHITLQSYDMSHDVIS